MDAVLLKAKNLQPRTLAQLRGNCGNLAKKKGSLFIYFVDFWIVIFRVDYEFQKNAFLVGFYPILVYLYLVLVEVEFRSFEFAAFFGYLRDVVAAEINHVQVGQPREAQGEAGQLVVPNGRKKFIFTKKYGSKTNINLTNDLKTKNLQIVYVSRETITICMFFAGKWFRSLLRRKP